MESILDLVKLTNVELEVRVTELLGGKWYYNPKQEPPERFLRLPKQAPTISGYVEATVDVPIAPTNWLGIPGYTDDLNLCRAWEQTAPMEYWRILMYVTNPTYNPGTDGEGEEMYLNFCRADGRARCIAFIFWKLTSTKNTNETQVA